MLWCVGGVLACCGVPVACLVVFLVVCAPDSDQRTRHAHRNKSSRGTDHAFTQQHQAGEVQGSHASFISALRSANAPRTP